MIHEHRRHASRCGRHQFTLIELLIVISIIAI
ncbi:MAG: prepilin-type N-terminal cleavage/methylation domain-containing protein, partial [Lentisphaerae bacterium]